MSKGYVLQGGCVLTLGRRTPNFTAGDVLIADGMIAEVGSSIRARGVESIDVSNSIVMPGFVDAHRHSWRTLLRGYDWTGSSDPSAAAALSSEDAYAAALAAMVSALSSGITTIADWVDPPGPGTLAEAVLEAHRDSGARTVAILPHETDPAPHDLPSTNTLAFGSNAGSPSAAADAWSTARDRGLRIHHHLGLSADDVGDAAALGDAELLGPDVTFVHCSSASEADLAAIASSGAGVVSTPASEMGGGLGAPSIQRWIDAGIRPGLGVGDVSLAPGDMFAQMRAINSIQHAAMFDLKLSGKASLPQLMTTRDVIRYATLEGAASIGMAEAVGSLEPGKRADVIVLRTDLPNIHPVNDPIGAVVWGMDTSNLSWVFVDGVPVIREGESLPIADRSMSLVTAATGRLSPTARDAGRDAS